MDLSPIWVSLQLASVTVMVLLVLGTPLAWWLAVSKSRWRVPVDSLVALPLVLLAKPLLLRVLPKPLSLALLPPLLVRAQVTDSSPSMSTRTSASERPRALRRIAKVPSGEKGECNAVVPSHYLRKRS